MKMEKIKKKIEEQIDRIKDDVSVCMKDFDRTGEPDSEYPNGRVHIDLSKSEVYHRGNLAGLEFALQLIKDQEYEEII